MEIAQEMPKLFTFMLRGRHGARWGSCAKGGVGDHSTALVQARVCAEHSHNRGTQTLGQLGPARCFVFSCVSR